MPAAKTRTLETPVLIVGGGPTGLCASIALSRLGVSSLLVEKHPSLSPFPRTREVHRKGMEIFRRWGLEDSIYASEVDMEPVMVWSESVTGPVLRRQDYVPRSNPDLPLYGALIDGGRRESFSRRVWNRRSEQEPDSSPPRPGEPSPGATRGYP